MLSADRALPAEPATNALAHEIFAAGFYNTAGFVDDTRAFASIPARHDLARRIDAGYLAGLVAERLLDLDEAIETAVDLAYEIPRTFYAGPRVCSKADDRAATPPP